MHQDWHRTIAICWENHSLRWYTWKGRTLSELVWSSRNVYKREGGWKRGERERERGAWSFWPPLSSAGSSRRPPLLFLQCLPRCWVAHKCVPVAVRKKNFFWGKYWRIFSRYYLLFGVVVTKMLGWKKQLAPSAITHKLFFFGSCWNKNKLYLGAPLFFKKS